MSVAIGLGCAEFPFSGAAAYWRWIDMCEAGGVDSIWQTDRIVGRQPFLESMTTMAALAGRTRRMRFGMNVVSLTFRDPDTYRVGIIRSCLVTDDSERDWPAVRAAERYRGQIYRSFNKDEGAAGGVSGNTREASIPQTWVVGDVEQPR